MDSRHHQSLVGAAVITVALALGACGSDDGRGQASGANCARGPSGAAAVTLRYRVESTPGRPGSFLEAKKGLCARLRRLGFRGVSVRAEGHELVMRARRSDEVAARRVALPGALTFFDWDTNVSGSGGPDVPFSGATGLFEAVQAAAHLRPQVEPTDLAPGATTSVEEADVANDTPPVARHYLFGADGRLLAGPAWNRGSLSAAHTAGSPGARILTVPRGILVVEAERDDAQPSGPPRYFVLEDDAEVSPGDIAEATAAVDDLTRQPILKLALTEHGRTALAALTRRIAQRSAQGVAPAGASGAGAPGRFAIGLDDRILSLPTVDPRENPQGIDGSTGVQIAGLGTLQDARRLALLLAEKPFPAHLVPLNPPR